ncbi:DNA polymerase [Ruegeria lacuscaerulensis]|uniref:DNA polymerase n=1 Tax=Ruegeria lacuscaerulensis TaxID=55218 RepID=UPI00147CABD6|nr:DNA polymerase [Ruegeria lacuscaerulensis]
MQAKLTFQPYQFYPKNRPSSRHIRYLVIGFDTEYQREPFVNADGLAEVRNQVLSYQYSCHVITPDNAGDEQHWSGIVQPKGPADDDRLTLAEFVEHALRDGFTRHPNLKVPVNVYLVAHFTRADVPGFSDFKEEKTRKAMNLENVRGLFMNVGKDIKINLKRGEKLRPIKLHVAIRDTIALAPAGAKSLAKLGEILGFEKMKLSDDPEQEQYYKENMGELLAANWPLFRAYAIRDAEVCAQYTIRMIRLYFEKTSSFKLPVTLTSIGVDLIREFWTNQGLDPLEIVGKEIVVEKYWSKKKQQYVSSAEPKPVQKLFWSEDFFTECYHGGRNEQFWFGPAPKGVWYDYDLTSAYPTAMALIGEPDWDTITHITSTDELLGGGLTVEDLAFANVDFEFPDDVRYPVLPVRTENGLLFPRKGNSTTHISEILLAKQLGAKIELVEGRRINSDRVISRREDGGREYGGHAEKPFLKFARHCIEERAKHPKKTLHNLFWKELVNSTYGKTAQGLRERRIYDLRDAETKPLKPSKITNPVYAAFITAFCRGVLSEIMNALPRDVQIFSVTTDGFLTTATDEQMREAAKGTLGRKYLNSRIGLAAQWSIYEVKHIIRQPVGWRTRGQATLRPSEAADWGGTGMVPKEDERVVLAKGSIKLNAILSKAEQNGKIVDLFFDRKPTDTMTVTMGAGIREMYEQGMDFVDKTMTKRLSMEFDWKRRPETAGDIAVTTEGGLSRTHLAFSTKPWDTVDQFNTTRDIWSDYNKQTAHCLKSLSDYRAWALYFEGKLAAQGKAGAYIAKEDGVLKRLRRDLCIAHKLRKAGTHKINVESFQRDNITPDYKLKVKELAQILNDGFGIPCTKTDVDNARKKKVFVPHQVPRTAQSVELLENIKQALFPELNVEQFLTSKAAFDLAVEDADMTQHPRDPVKDALDALVKEMEDADRQELI